MKIGSFPEIAYFEKSNVKLKSLTEEEKRFYVRVTGSFEKLRVPENGILL